MITHFCLFVFVSVLQWEMKVSRKVLTGYGNDGELETREEARDEISRILQRARKQRVREYGGAHKNARHRNQNRDLDYDLEDEDPDQEGYGNDEEEDNGDVVLRYKKTGSQLHTINEGDEEDDEDEDEDEDDGDDSRRFSKQNKGPIKKPLRGRKPKNQTNKVVIVKPIRRPVTPPPPNRITVLDEDGNGDENGGIRPADQRGGEEEEPNLSAVDSLMAMDSGFLMDTSNQNRTQTQETPQKPKKNSRNRYCCFIMSCPFMSEADNDIVRKAEESFQASYLNYDPDVCIQIFADRLNQAIENHNAIVDVMGMDNMRMRLLEFEDMQTHVNRCAVYPAFRSRRNLEAMEQVSEMIKSSMYTTTKNEEGETVEIMDREMLKSYMAAISKNQNLLNVSAGKTIYNQTRKREYSAVTPKKAKIALMLKSMENANQNAGGGNGVNKNINKQNKSRKLITNSMTIDNIPSMS